MFRQQLDDIKQYNENISTKLRQGVVTQKMNEERLRQEVNESVRIKEISKKMTRRGR